MNFLGKTDEQKEEIKKKVEGFFEKTGKEVFKGYVDDPRNTDNAWMETVAVHYHDDTGEVTDNFKLEAGDDASAVDWRILDGKRKLYANHQSFLKICAES